MSDQEFYQGLKSYLSQFSEGSEPIVPIFESETGIDRERTLGLVSFANMPEPMKRKMLAGGVNHGTNHQLPA